MKGQKARPKGGGTVGNKTKKGSQYKPGKPSVKGKGGTGTISHK